MPSENPLSSEYRPEKAGHEALYDRPDQEQSSKDGYSMQYGAPHGDTEERYN